MRRLLLTAVAYRSSRWLKSSYNCQFPVGTVFTSSAPCPGLVQAQTLP